MKDPVEGTATLVSYVETNARNEFDVTVIAQVIVTADGIPPTAVEWITGIPHSQLPISPGRVWNVQVDRNNPKHLKADTKQARQDGEAAHQAGRAEAEQLAASMRREAGSGTASPNPEGASPAPLNPAIQVIGADSAQAQAIMAAVQERLGVDLAGVVPSAAQPRGDDPVATLERLAKLRDAGVLTDAEFEQQKQRILSSG
ncbi:MAG: SHOCT domain-containing protein [Solirubrobacteraceae bacterium]